MVRSWFWGKCRYQLCANLPQAGCAALQPFAKTTVTGLTDPKEEVS